jgi:hypothetical protein
MIQGSCWVRLVCTSTCALCNASSEVLARQSVRDPWKTKLLTGGTHGGEIRSRRQAGWDASSMIWCRFLL